MAQRRGQALIEYVLISAFILAVLVALRTGVIEPGAHRVMERTADQLANPVENADTILGAWQ